MFKSRQVETHTGGKDDDQEDQGDDQPKAKSTKIEGMAVLRKDMILIVNERGDRPAIYPLSELPGSRWEVHLRPRISL